VSKSLSFCLIILAAAFLLVYPAVAQEGGRAAAPPRTITVSGEGIVRVLPDRAVLRFGIVTQDADPEEARRQNAQAAREAINAIRQLGVDERRIRMEMLQLVPAREFDPETRRWIERGFEVTRHVTVELDDVDRLPTVVALVVQRGANRLLGATYELRDRGPTQNEALAGAVRNAREKAALLATTAGADLGEVLTLSEEMFDFPRPMMRTEMAAAGVRDAAPEPEAYAPGEIEVRARIVVVYRLQ
jgi:uncharacterized protein